MDILDLAKIGKIKRIFRARNKLSFPGACCHITQRAPGKELLFLEKEDYLLMLHLIKEKSKEFNFDVFSFSLMPNHIHLQIRLQKANLSKGMKSLFETYAMAFNKKYERKGHVFCGPYRQALCLDDSYLLATSLYIHLNAVREGLVRDAYEYRWSSYRLYVTHPREKSFVNYEFILQLLNQDIQIARKIYYDLLKEAPIVKIKYIGEKPEILELFKNRIMNLIHHFIKSENLTLSKESNIFDELKIIEQIDRLKGKRLNNTKELQARKYLIEQLKLRGLNISQIANRLNLSRQTIYTVVNLTK